MLLDVLHLLLSAVLFWTCFCRQFKFTATHTRPDVRWAFVLLSMAALVIAIAPYAHALWPDLAEPYKVRWPDLLLLAGIVAVQAVTARHWRGGVPRDFRR